LTFAVQLQGERVPGIGLTIDAARKPAAARPTATR
jgi:hypothetical protein